MDEDRTARPAPLRVLLCDDAADIRALFRIELEAEGDITVIALASSGEEAIDLARSTRPDVTLVDLGLPGKSGLETIDDLVSERAGGAIVARGRGGADRELELRSDEVAESQRHSDAAVLASARHADKRPDA